MTTINLNPDEAALVGRVLARVGNVLSKGGDITLRTVATNLVPEAAFTWATDGLAVQFTDASSDGDGSIAARAWSFGDGGTSDATNPSHAYAADGSYLVTLTVTDNQGAQASVSQTVSVAAVVEPPPDPDPAVLWLDPANPDIAPIENPALALGEAFTTRYGATLRRVTDPAIDHSEGTVHNYSRQSAISADGRYAIAQVLTGQSGYPNNAGLYRVVDLATGDSSVLPSQGNGGLQEGHSDPGWYRDTHKIHHVGAYGGAMDDGRFGVKLYDVDSGTGAWLFQLPPTIAGVSYNTAFTDSEGRPSDDFTRWPWMLRNGDELVAFAVTDDTGAVLWAQATPKGAKPNNVSISPSGRYFVVTRPRGGNNDGDDPARHDGTFIYDLDTGAWTKVYTGGEHMDTIVCADGTDGMILSDYTSNSPDDGWVWWISFAAPTVRHRVLNMYGTGNGVISAHFCGLGPRGWALMSTYNTTLGDRRNWFENRIAAIELAPAGRIALLGDTTSKYGSNSYSAEPHAVTYHAGDTLIVTSNAGVLQGPVSDYALSVAGYWR